MQSERAMRPLLTPWGEAIDRACPLADYPRPQMRRENWQCLNGPWEYAIRDDDTRPEHWDGEILVPFSPESLLSGAGRQLLPGQALWYRRTLTLAPEAGCRLLLHFGAVDQHCTVWLNGREVGRHSGGYWPFALDITEAATTGQNLLEVRATDDTDTGCEAYGKQKLRAGQIWYTGQSGIWQTVWCEAVPEAYIKNLRVTPLYHAGAVAVAVDFSAGVPPCGRVEVLDNGRPVAAAALENGEAHIPLPGFKSWSPASPFLYTLRVTAGQDSVESYFGMRAFGICPGGDGHPRLTLNGAPIFHNGLLDQGYWSDGMYTPPSDAAMVWELEKVKALGYNMLRKHIKIEPMRWYYHCDRLGILVWQDFVSGGGPYRDAVVRVAPWLGINFKDGQSRYALHGRKSEAGRQVFRRDMARTVALLYNAACLAVWVPFNEGWGQFDAAAIAHALRGLDSTRAIDHASGYFDQGAGDFHSYHIYYKRFRPKRDRHGRVLALSEFGGYSLPVAGHMANDRRYGYKLFESRQALDAALEKLYARDVLPQMAHGLGAVVYTQVSDVEDEVNGLFTYDRRVIKPDEAGLRALNRRLYESFEAHL